MKNYTTLKSSVLTTIIWGLSLIFIAATAISMAVHNVTFGQTNEPVTGYALINGLSKMPEITAELIGRFLNE